MSKLTLLLAWVAPLWFIQTPWAWIRHVKAESLLNRKWQVKFGNHHYSVSPSLRTSLCAALRKVRHDRPAKTQPPKIRPRNRRPDAEGGVNL